MDAIPVYLIAIGAIYISILGLLRRFNFIAQKSGASGAGASFCEYLFIISLGCLFLLLNGFELLDYLLNVQTVFVGLLIAFNIGRATAKKDS